MAKFRSPFGGNEVWITQTNHTGANNTAVDFSAVAETPVYAVADGVVTYRSSGAGSYCIQTLDNSDLKVYYVHTYKWVGANTHVKKGQVVCYIAPQSLNGGYPTHLHFGLPVGKSPMDYFDRSIVFRTKYQAIKDIWFIGENLNWGKFQDLSYLSNTMSFKKGDRVEFTGSQNVRTGSGTTFPVQSSANVGDVATIIDGPRNANNYIWWDMRFDKGGTGWVADVNKFKIYIAPPAPTPAPTPVPEPPPEAPIPCPDCSKYQKEILDLLGENDMLESKLEGQIRVIEGKDLEIKTLKESIKDVTDNHNGLVIELDRIRKEKLEWMERHDKLKKQLEEGKENFIEKIVEWVRNILRGIVGE